MLTLRAILIGSGYLGFIFADGEGGKPKWMRWRTFQRLAAEHDAFIGESLGGMARPFGIKF
jgi:hypothetical protein